MEARGAPILYNEEVDTGGDLLKLEGAKSGAAVHDQLLTPACSISRLPPAGCHMTARRRSSRSGRAS